MTAEPTTTAANVQQVVPLLIVKSMELSLAFYEGGLGFTMKKHQTDEGMLHWCWLQLGAAAVMLQEMKIGYPGRNERLGVGVSMNFVCTDALLLYRQFRERGIEARRPFVGNGMWVVSLQDPNGYDLHFESSTSVSEGIEYSEAEHGQR